MNSVGEILKKHPEWAAVQSIFHVLQKKGHVVYLAGGCVRDALLGVAANDLDIATDASPEQIEDYFPKTVNVGKSFGVMRVLELGSDIEVATFRKDGAYADGRRPLEIFFSSPDEDAHRRDFTVNALFYDLANGKVLDFVQGLPDLKAQVLQTVGIAADRFAEDHLRLLRGARFVAQLNFRLEDKTFAAIKAGAAQIATVSGERVRDEMEKLLVCDAAAKGLAVMHATGLMANLFPTQKETSWNSFGAREFWQRLALFFRDNDIDDLKKNLKLLKLSSREEKLIHEAWTLWQAPAAFFSKRLGLRLQAFKSPGVEWALDVLIAEASKWQSDSEALIHEARLRGELPAPLLVGSDILGRLTGPAMGMCLAEAYCQQLEQDWKDKSKALDWLQVYLQKG